MLVGVFIWRKKARNSIFEFCNNRLNLKSEWSPSDEVDQNIISGYKTIRPHALEAFRVYISKKEITHFDLGTKAEP